MLSPFDLENKRIVTKKRKYDKAQIDDYLELVFENYRGLYDENLELHKKIKTLSDGIQYYRSIETTMQKALVLAEKTSKETKDAALLKAEAIEKDANARAEEIIDQAAQEYDRIREKCIILVQQFNQYKSQLKQVATTQLELVNSESFDVNSPNLESLEPSDLHANHHDYSSEHISDERENISENSNINVRESEGVQSVAGSAGEPVSLNSAGGIESSREQYPSQNILPEEYSNVPEMSQGKQKSEDEISLGSGDDFGGLTFSTDDASSLEQTTILPDIKSEKFNSIEGSADKMADEDTLSILTADTIDLSHSIRQAQEQKEQLENHVVKPAVVETKTVKEAEVMQPIDVRPVEPLDVSSTREPIQTLNPSEGKEKDEAHSLDALLQSMNMGGNKKNKKGQDEDPFEFLGSVDDF